MGAWGAGAFENDAALDFVSQIYSVGDLVTALCVATPDQEIELDEACRIIVVGECVAAMRGHASDDLPLELEEKLRCFGRPSRSLFHHTRDHLAAVMLRGELMELWAESDSAAFNLAMHDLLERLNLPITTGAKPKAGAKQPVFNNSPCAFCDVPMGEEEFSQFSISLDHGSGMPLSRGGWAHHRCLNAALHPKHMIRVYSDDADIDADELDALLERKPSATDD